MLDADGDGLEDLVWYGEVRVFKLKPRADHGAADDDDNYGEDRYEQIEEAKVAQVLTVIEGKGQLMPAASIKDPALRALVAAADRIDEREETAREEAERSRFAAPLREQPDSGLAAPGEGPDDRADMEAVERSDMMARD